MRHCLPSILLYRIWLTFSLTCSKCLVKCSEFQMVILFYYRELKSKWVSKKEGTKGHSDFPLSQSLGSSLCKVWSLQHIVLSFHHTTCLPFRNLTICSWSLKSLNTRAFQLNIFYVFCDIIAENIIHDVAHGRTHRKSFSLNTMPGKSLSR